jgi:glycosyltransferase involved in cell wall biosynthesis
MKISIITPCFNSEKYIKETIESVLSQKGDFELEYIIVDGGSTDGTVEYLKKIDETICKGEKSFAPTKCFKYISEPDKGMYDAVNKGFSMATGDIFAWINSDDIYYEGAFERILEAFQKHKDVDWIVGISNTINENSEIIIEGCLRFYNTKWIQKGYYGAVTAFISQESVFFRKSLWDKVGKIDTELKLAGDYWLWKKFAGFTELYSLDYLTSAFRKRKGQLSSELDKYLKEAKLISGVDKNSFKLLHYFTKYEGHFSYKTANLLFRFFNKKAKFIEKNLTIRESHNFYRVK